MGDMATNANGNHDTEKNHLDPPDAIESPRQTIILSQDETSLPGSKVYVIGEKPYPKEVNYRRAENENRRHAKRYEMAKHSTICFNSLGVLKILEITFAAAIVACLWAQCRFTFHLSGYCYGPASAFQLQNFPVFVSLFSIFFNAAILIAWLATWEQATPQDDNNQYKRRKVAQTDTLFAFIFVLMNIGAAIVESWMSIKYHQGYSCPSCYTLVWWVIATALLFLNTILYAYNITLCLHQRRLNAMMRVRL